MSDLTQTKRLFQRVDRRLRLASMARSSAIALFILAGLFAAGLLTARLSGTIPDVFSLQALAVLPVAALLLGVVFHRKPKTADLARLVDSFAGTKDLFLTTALLDKSPGEFHPLVVRDAETRAPSIVATDVIAWNWQRAVPRIGVVAAAILAAVWFLPQFDPFGKVAEAKQEEQRTKRLAEARKATEARRAQLRRAEEEDEKKSEADEAIENLKTALNNMKPKARQENFEKIQERQKNLGQEWKQMNDKLLKELMAQKPVTQQFGGTDQDKLQKWTKELQNGSKESLHKEIEELKEAIETLAKSEDPLERQEAQQKLRKKLEELSELAEKKLGSKPLSAAIQRAMEQLEMAKSEGLSTEALESLAESLDLTEQELEQIAQSAKDLKNLEQALKVCQMAKKLNDQDKLDGEQGQACKTLGDYEKLYEQLMAQGNMEGEGESDFNGPGMGRGGIAPEDDSTTSDFKNEKSEAQVTAGKILLTLKTKGKGDENTATKSYRDAIRDVRQGTSEAIQQERIPPGYHDGIKKYFDSLEKAAPAPPATKESRAAAVDPGAEESKPAPAAASEDK